MRKKEAETFGRSAIVCVRWVITLATNKLEDDYDQTNLQINSSYYRRKPDGEFDRVLQAACLSYFGRMRKCLPE